MTPTPSATTRLTLGLLMGLLLSPLPAMSRHQAPVFSLQQPRPMPEHSANQQLVLVPGGPVQELAPISLPAPEIQGGKPLMEALRDRRSTRSFLPDDLPLQTLSNLLWAGFGVNRPESGYRTAPSAVNWQEVEIYLTTREGAYRYDARANRLDPVRAGDFRAFTGTSAWVASAPLNLVYVADLSKITRDSEEEKNFYSAIDTGFIAQNVYLFCASEGLATVVRAQVNREALAEALGLRPDQKIIVAQTVGYPGSP